METKSRWWDTWSVSKLKLLMRCPRAFYFRYVLGIESTTILQLFGTGIHRMVQRFFTLKHGFKSSTSFMGAWKYYWFRELLGKRATQISNMKKDDPGKYFAIGAKILMLFYEENLPYRDGRLPRPLVEQRFPRGFCFSGHKLKGVIDRIQPVNDGDYEIWDYKTGLGVPDEPELFRDLQFTTYSLESCAVYGRAPVAMKVILLRADQESQALPVPPRTDQHYLELKRQLDEARVYVANIFTPPALRWKEMPFRFLNPEDIERAEFSSRPGRQCNSCEFEKACRGHQIKDPFREHILKLDNPGLIKPVLSEQLTLDFIRR